MRPRSSVAPHASSIVTLKKANGKCAPDGVNVPDYIADQSSFLARLHRELRHRLFDNLLARRKPLRSRQRPSRPGGDVWTADAAIEIMRRETWSGLFLTFGGIDKIAHMLGEQDGAGLVSVPSQYRLADALRIADAQLGRILDELEAQGLAERTMVVVTADHGGQRHDAYLGNGRFQSCCTFENSPEPVEPPYWVDHLNQLGKLRTAYVDSSMTLWLADHSVANELAITRGLQDVSGVTEIYAKRRTGESTATTRSIRTSMRRARHSGRGRCGTAASW